ncbi:MAG TPA: hypothetical protein VMH86_12985 [Rhizomicrobium sp.]|nr:hypothetical protein [Rhizomicrobium sp.]
MTDLDFTSSDRLFHYTNSAGLYGILTSGTVWATHFRFLNDRKEFVAANNMLNAILRGTLSREIDALYQSGHVAKPPQAVIDQKIDDALAYLLKIIVDPAHEVADPFVFSMLSCNPSEGSRFTDGTLQHWHSYASTGGYAIQLNPEKLLAILDRAPGHSKDFAVLRKVSYMGDPRTAALEHALNSVVELASKVFHCAVFGRDKLDLGKYYEPILNILGCIKSEFFRDEREARIVLFRGVAGSLYPLRFREAAGLHIPYIEILGGGLLTKECAIERIIVGPHARNIERIFALKLFLRTNGLTAIDVHEADIPLQ